MKELKKRIGLDNLSPFHIKLKIGLGYPVPIQNKSKIGLGYPVPIQNKLKIGLGLPSTSSKNAKTGAGFSLIELLVGVAIIITATTIVLAIIVSSFRISSKTTINSVIRQNGNYTLSQISRIVQFATEFRGVSESGVVSPNTYELVCDPAKTYHYLRVTYGETETERIISCTNSGIEIDGNSTIDENRIQVVPNSCKITCTRENAAVSAVIGINFDLSTKNTVSVPEKTAKINFSTTVKMRN